MRSLLKVRDDPGPSIVLTLPVSFLCRPFSECLIPLWCGILLLKLIVLFSRLQKAAYFTGTDGNLDKIDLARGLVIAKTIVHLLSMV